MAKKSKVYAVRQGRQTGIFRTWDACEAAVKGYPEAEYKSFSSVEDANAYLGLAVSETAASGLPEIPETADTLTAYVDGSYQESSGVYAFGCVFLLHDGRTFSYYGNGNEPETAKLHNVAGEMLGAMYAASFAYQNGFRALDICYDYLGIEMWATRGWKCKQELTKKYAGYMQQYEGRLAIRYHKVTAHANVYYNEMVDKLAKQGLEKGNGIPPVERIKR